MNELALSGQYSATDGTSIRDDNRSSQRSFNREYYHDPRSDRRRGSDFGSDALAFLGMSPAVITESTAAAIEGIVLQPDGAPAEGAMKVRGGPGQWITLQAGEFRHLDATLHAFMHNSKMI